MKPNKTKFKQTEIGMIPEEWEETNLGTLGELKNGVNFTRNDFGEGFPIINVTHLFRGRHATIDNLDEIKRETIKNAENYFVRKGDILFTRSSLKHSGVGQAAMVHNLPKKKTLFSGFIIRFRKYLNVKINEEFLNYLVRSEMYRNYMRRVMAGVTITNINQQFLSNLPIPLPPLPEQRAIAKILSDLDSKIELNQQMNKTLESIGQALFKHWFVDFEFPNEEGKPYKSCGGEMVYNEELGKEIPNEWRVKKLNEISHNFDSKRIPLSRREREARRGSYPYYGAAGILDYVDDFIFDGTYVLMGEDGSVIDKKGYPILQFVWGKFWVNNHAHVLKGKIISDELLFLLLKSTNVNHIITGAVQPKINQNNMNKLEFALPEQRALSKLEAVFTSLVEKIRRNQEESLTLSAIHDSLLPKLMSGKIRVPIKVN